MSNLVLTLTTSGIDSVIAADKNGLQAEITHVAFGDTSWEPTEAATALQNERRRISVTSSTTVNNNQLHISVTEDGTIGYWVREIGVFLSDGTLLAIWSHATDALAYKSATTDLIVAFDLVLAALPVNSVTITAASGFDLTPATTERRGTVRLATLDDMSNNATDRAITPQLARRFFVAHSGTVTSTEANKTTDDRHTYFTFTQSGTLVLEGNAVAAEYLIVGGGGSGGIGDATDPGGGGGAGGLLRGSKTIAAGTHQIVVGAGGAQGSAATSSTAFNHETLAGGNGADGGRNLPIGGAGTLGQGSAGGNASGGTGASAPSGGSGGGGSYSNHASGGGGGAGGAGQNGVGDDGGAGGPGLAFPNWASATSTGSSDFYAGGGGGSTNDDGTEGAGGSGGGGNGGSASGGHPDGHNGMVNTGGGGGGGADSHGSHSAGASGNGGSGLVIVRFLTSDLAA